MSWLIKIMFIFVRNFLTNFSKPRFVIVNQAHIISNKSNLKIQMSKISVILSMFFS